MDEFLKGLGLGFLLCSVIAVWVYFISVVPHLQEHPEIIFMALATAATAFLGSLAHRKER